MLTKEQILAAEDLPREPVEVPQWGGTAYIRTLTGAERDAFEATMLSEDRKRINVNNVRANLLVRCIVNENGERLFVDSDATALGAKSSMVLDRLFAIAQRLNGLGAEDVEALAKN